MEEVNFRPMYLVERLLAETGYKVTYAFDDLVFIEHTLMLIQFSAANEQELFLFINKDLDDSLGHEIQEKLSARAKTHDITLDYRGTFSAEQKTGCEEVELTFY